MRGAGAGGGVLITAQYSSLTPHCCTQLSCDFSQRIVNADRAWHLRAEDEGVADEWAVLLSAAIDTLIVAGVSEEETSISDHATFRSRTDTLDPGPMLAHLRALVATADGATDLSCVLHIPIDASSRRALRMSACSLL